MSIDPALLTKPHIKPLGDQIVVLPVYKERDDTGIRVTHGGVALPDTAEDEPVECRVVGLGTGYIAGCPKCEPEGKQHVFEVQIGEKVLAPLWKCLSVKLGEIEYFILSERDVVLRLE